MMTPTLYLRLCTEFFDLDKPTPPQDEYNFYRAYVQQAKGSILEAMCGSGRYLIPMLEEGYTVDGIDASPFMLNSLHARCAQKHLTPHVWQQFLQTMQCTKKYSLIFITDSSFCLILNPEDIANALINIYSALKQGGTFVFDLETIYATPAKIGTWQKKTHTKNDGTHVVMNTFVLPIKDQIVTVICRYELMRGAKIEKTEIERFQIRLYHPEEIISILQNIGFTDIKCIKAYDHQQKPGAYDYTVVYECKKL